MSPSLGRPEPAVSPHQRLISRVWLAAMTLMIAAEAKGLVSGPMIGFDPEGAKREFGISDRCLPVMLLAVGYPAPGNRPRKPRLSVDEVLAMNGAQAF